MTEQNSLARGYSPDDMNEDDPLEELARIVSGEKRPKAKDDFSAAEDAMLAAAAEAVDFDHSEFYAESQPSADGEWQDGPQPGADAASYPDLEAELVQELEQSVEAGVAHAGQPGIAASDEAPALDSEAAAEEPSLEDQLLVELGLEGADEEIETAAREYFAGSAAPETVQAGHAAGTGSDDGFAAQAPDNHSGGQSSRRSGAEHAARQPSDSWLTAGEADDFGLANDFQETFEAELALDRTAEMLNGPGQPETVDADLAQLNFPSVSRLDAAAEDAAAFEAEPQAPVREEVEFSEDLFAPQPVHSHRERARPTLQPMHQEDIPDFGFDSAFQAEMAVLDADQVTAVARQTHASHPAAPAASAAPIASERELDDHFAAAFAAELGFNAEPAAQQPAPRQPMQIPVRPQPTAEQAYAAPAREPAAGNPAARRNDFANEAPGYPQQEAGYPQQEAGYPQQEAGYDETGYAGTDEYDDYDEYQQQEAPVEARRAASKGFRLAGLALSLALIAGLGAVTYGVFRGGETASDPLVVKADKGPIKVKPDDPGGTTVANQDQAAYERVSGKFGEDAKQKKLVSDTEKPVDIVPAGTETAGAALPGVPVFNNGLPDKGEARLTAGQQPAVTSPLTLQPRRVRTVTVLRDGTIVQPKADTPSATAFTSTGGADVPAEQALQSIDGAHSTGAIAVPQARPSTTTTASQNAPAPIAATPLAAPTVTPVQTTDPVRTQAVASVSDPNAPIALAPQQTENIQTASVPAGAGEPLVNTGAPISEWVVQVSSQRTPEDAQASYHNLQNRFPSLLQGRRMAIRKAELQDRGVFYRVRIGSTSKDDAVNFCQRLQAAGGSCFVTR